MGFKEFRSKSTSWGLESQNSVKMKPRTFNDRVWNWKLVKAGEKMMKFDEL